MTLKHSKKRKVYRPPAGMHGKGHAPLLLPLALILLAGVGVYFFLSSGNGKAAKLPAAENSGSTSANSPAAAAPDSPTHAVSKLPQAPRPNTIVDPSGAAAESTPEQPPSVDLTKKLPANPEDFPEDLRNQLNSPPPELPPEMKAQLEGPLPEIPDDIKRALQTPPRPVTPEEVNTAFEQ